MSYLKTKNFLDLSAKCPFELVTVCILSEGAKVVIWDYFPLASVISLPMMWASPVRLLQSRVQCTTRVDLNRNSTLNVWRTAAT